MASRDESYLLVAAIDFGTTYSGYAFSFASSDKDPTRHEKIRMNKNWGAAMGFQSYKAPTSVLTTKDGKFLKFGYDAEQAYIQALEDDEDSDDEEETKTADMLLFRHFKMMLHKQKDVNVDSTIAAIDGTIRKAVDIFAHALRYMKDHMLNAIKLESGCLPNEQDIRWVITVPAIWSDTSKNFMREAAYLAGCTKQRSSRKYIIALEPEAASMCCRSMNLAQHKDVDDVGFPMGTKYLIIDCGGGTIDITAHEVQFDKKIKELTEASGGPWGGTGVDLKFKEFLAEVLGNNFLNTYIEKYPNEWLHFLTNFEKAKTGFTSDEKSKINVGIPFEMVRLYASMNTGEDMRKVFRKKANVKCPSGMLSFQHDLAQTFFDDCKSAILEYLRALLKVRYLSKIDYIFMVGGFADCGILQEAIRFAFEKSGTKILIPGEAQMAILKGAVLYGHNPHSITERILRYTYGCEATHKFNGKIHDHSRKITNSDGNEMCDSIFDKFVQKGTLIKVTHVERKTYESARKGTRMNFSLYSYEGEVGKGIRYVDEPGFQKVGHIRIIYDNSSKAECDNFQLCFTFGNTEILVEEKNLATGEKAAATIDFL